MSLDVYMLIELLIILAGLGTVVLEIRKIKKLGFHPVTFFAAAVALYWALFYTYQISRIWFDISIPDHRTFVRSGILLSVVLLLTKAIRVNRKIK